MEYPYLTTPPSFSLAGCANGAPRLSLFHCSVSGPHRGGQPPSPWFRCVPVHTPYRRCGIPHQRRLLGPRMSCGVTSAMGPHNNLPPVRSRAQSSLWRTHHVPPHPPLVSAVCVLCVHSLVWHGCHPGCRVMGGDVLGGWWWCGRRVMGGDWCCSGSCGLGHLHLLAHFL